MHITWLLYKSTQLLTLTTDSHWLWDHTIKFARWQHPAMGLFRVTT